MKESLHRLKGTVIPTSVGEITLSETFREDDCEYDQLYYSTQHDSITVKVYDLEKEESAERFHHQEQWYLKHPYDEFAEPLCIREIQIKKNPFGFVALKICKGTTLKQTASGFTYSEWLNLVQFAIGFIQKLKNQKHVYLNFHPSNISKTSFGELKITDPQFMASQGSYEELSVAQQQLIDICEKQYLYRAPQLLDEYSKGRIDYKSDLYSFAIVLYEMMYHQYPFESKLAQISCNYRSFPEQSFFSLFISKILKPYNQRQSLENLKTMIQNERKKVPRDLNIKALSSGSTAQSKTGGILSGLSLMFSKLTTQTEGWYLNFTQNDDSSPQQKYMVLIVNKLYKKQAKLQKLQLVILKYLEQSVLPQDENRFLKSLLLLIQLFRRGPNFINYQWEEIIRLIQSKAANNVAILQLCQFCRQKITLHLSYKSIFRGNFYIEDLSKFKLVTVEVLQNLQNYLNWLIDSIKNKFLFVKKDLGAISYAKQLYCDQIQDVISVLIFSALCIRKDNELKLRKDTLNGLREIEKKLNGQLQKISYLSNHLNTHAIYNLESEYFYYQEEVQIRENPLYSSLEHFYKNAREYKGLCVPQNFALTYSSGDQKEFLSTENNKSDKQQGRVEKNYFINDDEEYQEQSFKVVETPSPDKSRLKEKILEQLREKPKKQQKIVNEVNFFQLKNIKSEDKQEPVKKTVNFNQFFKMQAKPTNTPTVDKQQQFFNFGKKPQIDPKPDCKKKQDFSFFDDFLGKDKKQKETLSQEKKNQQNFNNFFENFGVVKDKEPKGKEKSGLTGSSSQKIIQDNHHNAGLMKKSMMPNIPSPQKSKANPKIDPELLNTILSGLKLKELKQMILNNQEIIIEFSKLKLQKIIGSGSAGEVYLGKYNNEVLAIKKVKTKENPNALKEFERQLVTYIKIKRNPYLVSLVGLSKSGEDYYLLTQFCNSGSLFDLLHKKANTVALSWQQRITLAIQIAKGMMALHQMKPPIIHRDLKSLNVFVSEANGVYTAKVADFGLSRSPESEMMTMYLGTLHWMAPELLDNKQYSNKVDIYSFAVVLWEICSRKTPYNELSSPMAIIKHVTIQKKRPNLGLIPPDCPPEIINIMKACWSQQPSERPVFPQIIQRLSKIVMFF